MGKPLFFIFLSVFLGALGQVTMKYGTMQQNPAGSFFAVMGQYLTNFFVVTGLGFYALSAMFWIFSISQVHLSYAYPMVALSYVLVFVLSYFLFQEPISQARLIGLALIVAGVVIISRS